MNYKLLKHSIRNTTLSDGAFRLLVTLIENYYYKVGSPLGIGIDYLITLTGKSADSLVKLLNELKSKEYILDFTDIVQSNRLTITFNDNIETVIPKPNNDITTEDEVSFLRSTNEEYNLMMDECCKIPYLRD